MTRARRLFDIVGALAGLAVFAPVMLLIAIAVLLDDGRPILFPQERLGYRRRPFRILKFRSMRDGRVTRVGRWLRASGLDELPQFFNILSGEMSAVGPRPLTADDVARLGWEDRAFDFRWSCRPGLTGLAQLLGSRADADALQFDRVHANGWGPLLDCELIAWSFAVNAFGKPRVRAWLKRDAGLSRVKIAVFATATGSKQSAQFGAESSHDRPEDLAGYRVDPTGMH